MKLVSYLLALVFPLMCSQPLDREATLETQADSGVYESDIVTSKTAAQQPASTIPQKLIKTAYLKFETPHIDTTYNHLITTIKALNGFVQDDNSNTSYNRITRHLVVRIPTTNFQPSLDAITKKVSHFDTKRISAKDVTETFIDIEARLKAKRTLEARYLDLLKKAQTVKEVLEIERELSEIREAIEAKEGRLKYLQHKVNFSTIDIEFYTLTSTAPIGSSYGTKMWNAIKGGFEGISIFFLGLLYIWPLLVFVIIGIFLLRKRLKKSKDKKTNT